MKKIIKNGIFKYSFIYLFALFLAVIIGVSLKVPEKVTCMRNSGISQVSCISEDIQLDSGDYSVGAKLFGLVPIKDVSVKVLPDTKLVPVGDIFGVKFFTKGVIIIDTAEIETKNGFINIAEKSGLKKNDIITTVSGKEVNTIEELAGIVETSGGNTLYIEYLRDGNTLSTTLTPVLSLTDRKYKTGIWVRDSTAGIGTITYYNPQNGSFAGLGHGICDIDTGNLMPLLKATVVDVDITGIVKGKSGIPGELKGSFSTVKKGELFKNDFSGVFGKLEDAPHSVYPAIEVAPKEAVCEGNATILTNADGKGIKEYSVRLSKIDKSENETKCFVIEIVDKDLLALTGGIVQGMSGSPILQNGKIVGAVTHVFVNDPTRGYGIFIENMLSEAEKIK